MTYARSQLEKNRRGEKGAFRVLPCWRKEVQERRVFRLEAFGEREKGKRVPYCFVGGRESMDTERLLVPFPSVLGKGGRGVPFSLPYGVNKRGGKRVPGKKGGSAMASRPSPSAGKKKKKKGDGLSFLQEKLEKEKLGGGD